MDDADEFHACGGSEEVLALFADVASLEECLYDGGASGGASYAVLFHGIAQLFVFDELSCCLHGAQQGGFGIWFWGLGPFLCQ